MKFDCRDFTASFHFYFYRAALFKYTPSIPVPAKSHPITAPRPFLVMMLICRRLCEMLRGFMATVRGLINQIGSNYRWGDA